MLHSRNIAVEHTRTSILVAIADEKRSADRSNGKVTYGTYEGFANELPTHSRAPTLRQISVRSPTTYGNLLRNRRAVLMGIMSMM